MDFEFTKEQEEIRQKIREFVRQECPRERIQEMDSMQTFPLDIYKKMAEWGFMALPFPKEWGGLDGTVIDFVIVCEETARCYAALCQAYTVTVLHGGEDLLLYGSEKQKKEMIPKIISGDLRFALGMTEPDAGSDVSAIKTRGERKNDGWLINGNKMFTSAAHMADYINTCVRTDPNAGKYGGFTWFFIPSDARGLTISPLQQLGGQPIHTNEVALEDVWVPDENILGRLNDGWNQVWGHLDVERVVYAAQLVGIMKGVLDYSKKYVEERKQFGRPIIKFQAISSKLAEMATKHEAARLLVYEAGWLAANHKPCSKEASMAKYFAGEMVREVALKGLHLLGRHGYLMEHDSQRYFREGLLGAIAGGTSQIMLTIIANNLD
jgi:alkylation response protein AidB-like acyl-CoA dehydrogenase